MIKFWFKLLLVILLPIALITACSAADIASTGLSTAADNFEITRRIVFYNSITNDYILTIEGKCALGNYDVEGEVSVTCKVGDDRYKKHFLGLSDNVTYIAEQIESVQADPYRYRVIFRPLTIVPDIEIDTPGQ